MITIMLTGVTQMFMESETNVDGSLFDPDYKLFLLFDVEGDRYGVAIEHILEVKSWSDVKVRPLVHTPDFLLGVFNLRGSIVPVVDLRIKWACTLAEFSTDTAVVILSIGKYTWALVVDKIREVVGLRKEDITYPPSLSTKLDVRYFLGLANRQNASIMLLDIERIMTSEEMGLLDAASEG